MLRLCRTNISRSHRRISILLVAGRDAVPNFLRVCMVSTAKKLAERGDDAVKFLAAEMGALRFRAGAQG